MSSDFDNVNESCIEMINQFGVILKKFTIPSQALGTFNSPRHFSVIDFLQNPKHGKKTNTLTPIRTRAACILNVLFT